MILDPNKHYFPDADDPALKPFKDAFVRLMFAHAAFERRVYDLAGVVTGDPGFGEQGKNRWKTHEGPEEMRALIGDHAHRFSGGVPEVERIAACLQRAIPLCFERNLLAHGHWWAIDAEGSTIIVRSDIVRKDAEQHFERSFSQILDKAEALEYLELELYQLQSAVEDRLPSEPPLDVISADAMSIILRFVDEIVPKGCASVWLAGSRAKGTHRLDSDWDVIAFHPDADPRPEQLFHSNQTRDLPGFGVIELVIAHPDHWNDSRPYMVDLREFGVRLR